MKITINEALSWLKTLKERRAELIRLRDANATRTLQQRHYPGERMVEEPGRVTTTVLVEPTYKAPDLDKLIATLSKEIRVLETAIKRMNAKVVVEDYDMDDKVLGELV